MKPTSACIDAIIAALLADPDSFGGSGANNPYELRLGTTTIVPGETSEFVETTIGGYAAKETEEGFTDGYDAITGQRALTLQPGAGGFIWHANESAGPLNQTLRSWEIFNVAANITVATGNLAEPIPVTRDGQQISLPSPQVTIAGLV